MPIVAFAPGRLSTITVVPCAARMLSAMTRATTSVTRPAGKGTMMRMV
jgi:hypothetical protein